MTQNRGFNKIDQLLTRAKLDKNEMLPLVQNVTFGSDIASDEYKLLELDNNMLDYLLQGNRFLFDSEFFYKSLNHFYIFKVL